MEMLDVTSYLYSNLVVGFVVSTIVVAIVWVLSHIASDTEPSDANSKYITIGSVVVGLLVLIGYLMPTHEKIFDLKVSKIKNEMLTEENVGKGVEHLEALLKKLECKYLECKESENK